MKVLLSAYACDPYKGSEEGSGWNWAYNLAKSGCKVCVITTPIGKPSIERYLENSKVENLEFMYVDWTIGKINFEKVLNFKFSYYIKYIIWQYKILSIAKKLDEKLKFDIIHHVSWGSLQLGSVLWKLNKPFIFGTVGGGQITNKIFKNEFGNAWRVEKIREFITNFKVFKMLDTGKAAAKADLVLVTNKETLILAKNYGARNVKLMLDTSIPEEYLHSITKKEKNEKIKILWVGRLGKRKGLSLFLKIVQNVKNPNVEFFVIGGEGDSRYEIEDFINKKRDNRLKWLGQIDWTEVKKYYEIADLFVFTSLRDSFGSQVLEAMAHGLPVVALNQFGVRDFIPDDACIKIEIKDNIDNIIKNFAEAIDFLCCNEDVRNSMSKSALNFAKSCTWNTKISIIKEYYRQLTQEFSG